MPTDTSIGPDDARERVDDKREKPDLTREDIESGNDRNVSSDQGNRSGRTNKLPDEGIQITKP